MIRLSYWILSIVLFLSQISSTFSTHIVGGGFNMISEGDNLYRIRLTLYFDAINGSAGARDSDVNFTIYRTDDNTVMQVIKTGLASDSGSIQYQQRSCGFNPNIKTDIFYYETLAELLPQEYNSPGGYYIVWERCCRNYIISNVKDPNNWGQFFLMHFPPTTKNGVSFANDSPIFKPVPSDIFCINQVSTIDFSTTDFDGDSLVFDLVNPIGAKNSFIKPDTSAPAPHDTLEWLPGFSRINQINGNPPLRINSKTGVLQVKPNKIGLFVFAVRCQEFRKGVKIGEIRREFQQQVIDCPVNSPPTVTVRNPIKPQNLKDYDTLFISNEFQTPTCITVKVTDLQVGQRVTINALPLNFTPIAPITGDTTKLVTNSTDTVRLSFCLPACVGSTKENPWHMWIIAYDNGCSGSLSDTLDVFIVLKIPPVTIPAFYLDPPTLFYTILSEDSLKVNAYTTVSDSIINSLSASAFDKRGRPRSLSSLGMDFTSESGPGNRKGLFEWKAPCVLVNNQPISVVFTAITKFCNQPIKLNKTIVVQNLDSIRKPQIFVSNEESIVKSYTLAGKTNTTTEINLVAKIDNRNQFIELSTSVPRDELEAFKIKFSGKKGIFRVNAPFTWNPSCDLDVNRFSKGLLMVATSVSCNQINRDTLTLYFEKSISGFSLKEPYNLITNNGDLKNDNLTVSSFVENIGCGYPFEGLTLYNRWGEKVYETQDPDFIWPNGIQKDAGLYFYLIRFEGKSYTSWVQVVE